MTDAWDLGTLKRLAEQATPGPWRVSENEIQQVHGDTHVVCFGHDYDDYGYAKENDLALIAALSPDVVLRLIDMAIRWEVLSGLRPRILTLATALDDLGKFEGDLLISEAAASLRIIVHELDKNHVAD